MNNIFCFICTYRECASLPCDNTAVFTHIIRQNCLMRICPENINCRTAILSGEACGEENAHLMIDELKRMHCSSLVADVEGESIACLDALCRDEGIKLFVPPKLFRHTQYAIVIENGGVSSGSYRRHLGQLCERYGNRFALDLTPLRIELTPPCDGCGAILSCEELALRVKNVKETCFSSDLNARYFTYCDANVMKYVIYDDAQSLCEKARLALSCGAQTVFVPYAEVKNMTGELI